MTLLEKRFFLYTLLNPWTRAVAKSAVAIPPMKYIMFYSRYLCTNLFFANLAWQLPLIIRKPVLAISAGPS